MDLYAKLPIVAEDKKSLAQKPRQENEWVLLIFFAFEKVTDFCRF
jgi:hypothetical protein